MNNASYHHRWRWRGWPLRVAAFALLLALWAIASCSADSETPVGSDLTGDILGSVPGSTFVDTLYAYADTVIPVYTLIDDDPELSLGIAQAYQRSVILRANFGDLPGTTVSLTSAKLRVRMSVGSSIRGRILYLGTPYSEGDTVSTLDTTYVLPDPDTGEEVRTFTFAETEYPIDPDTVAAWIAGSRNNGVAIVYTGSASDTVSFYSSEATTKSDRPWFNLVVQGGSSEGTNYNVVADATYMRPLTTTSDLITSDGFVRRIYWRIPLDQIDSTAAVNRATARFYLTDASILGEPQTMAYYVPESSDPASPGILKGTYFLSQSVPIDTINGWLDLPLTGPVLGMLAGTVADNGFVLRYGAEDRRLRQAAFYTSAAVNDTLRPRVIITATTPAEFDR